jgi:Cap4 SAVED domain
MTATDGHTASNVPHRQLVENATARASIVAALKPVLVRHHASPEAIERSRKQNEALDRLGLASSRTRLRRFPTNSSTRKGNLAEIVLAEYVTTVGGLALPVYRLRHNTNVDQSMKGDDVLAFDLDSNPQRILVGESKFRGLSAVKAVREIAEALERSHKAGLPASLQFVADRLFETGQHDLGARVMNCVVLLAQNRLRLDYVGLLLSDQRASERVNAGTPAGLARLVMLSLGVNAPDGLVSDCFDGLE